MCKYVLTKACHETGIDPEVCTSMQGAEETHQAWSV